MNIEQTTSSYYRVGGNLPPNAPSYVTREADEQLYKKLKDGEFCYVLNSRQMGKSSLWVRVKQRLEKEDYICAAIDLSGIGQGDLEQWYTSVTNRLTKSFNSSVKKQWRGWWKENNDLSPVERLHQLIEELLLPSLLEHQKIVVFIDEIDYVKGLPFSTDDFFALIRSFFNERSLNPQYNQITFCLLGVATPSDLIENKKLTPFNIGIGIELNGFRLEEVESLIKGLEGKVIYPESVMSDILYWTGGQPFLTQRLCRLVVQENNPKPDIFKLVQSHIIDTWEAQDEQEHLKTIKNRILSNEQRVGCLLELYRKVLKHQQFIINNSSEERELQLSGLVIRKGNVLEVYNPIYTNVFDEVWIDTELAKLRPYAEALSSWLASNCTDESRLLRGQTLQDALKWASQQRLSDEDNRFLRASQELDTREMRLALQREKEAKEVAERANKILTEAKQKAEIALKKEQEATRRYQELQRQIRRTISYSRKYIQEKKRLKSRIQDRKLNPSESPDLNIPVFGGRFIAKLGTIVRKCRTPLQRWRTEVVLVAKIYPLLQKLFVLGSQVFSSIISRKSRRRKKHIHKIFFLFLFFITSIFLTSIIAYRFYNQPQLSVGTLSPVKVVAPRDEEFVDEKTTEEKRKEIRTGIIPIVQRDIELTSQLKADLNKTLTEINQFRRQSYDTALREVSNSKTSNLTPEVLIRFLDLDESNWQTTQKNIKTTLNRILSQGIPSGTPDYLLQEIINNQLESAPPSVPQTAITDVLIKILHNKHNLIVDKEASRQRAEKAALAMKPVIVEIKAGDVIVEAGEEITQEAFVLLDGFQLSRRGINWLGLAVSAILVIGAVCLFIIISHRLHRPTRLRDYLLLALLSLTTSVLGIFNLGYTNLPAVALLTSSFYGSTLAIAQVILLSGLSTFAAPTINWSYVLAGTAGGLFISFVAGRLTRKEQLAMLGVACGILQGSLYFVGYLIAAPVAGTIWSIILPEAIIYGLSGVAWYVMALGVSPYLEQIFNVVRASELAQLSTPLPPLTELFFFDAPTLFRQTLLVAVLAEEAARELGYQVNLVRAGAMYHSIGEISLVQETFEEFQLENQEILNPWEQAERQKESITEGLILASDHKLPRIIQSFIVEHKGTILMEELYQKAQQQSEQPVNESDFRYQGPTPQSGETGIVMLASACCEVLISMKDSSQQEIFPLLNNIIDSLILDNQLSDSGLTQKEIGQITNAFLRVWDNSVSSKLPQRHQL